MGQRNRYIQSFTTLCLLGVLSTNAFFTIPTTTRPPSFLYSTTAPDTALPDPSTLTGIGDADRAIRHGMSLEANGLFRTAHAAYHEAATLYQCYLDSPTDDSEFGHVTDLQPSSHVSNSDSSNRNSCDAFLAYACTRLAHLSYNALGDPKAATRLYRDAVRIDPNPSAISFDGIGRSIEASTGGKDLEPAVTAYRQALELGDSTGEMRFHLAVALERLGKTKEADEMLEELRRSEMNLASLVDSWGYVRWHSRRVDNEDLNLYLGSRSMLQIGIEAAMDLVEQDKGLVCEFGVASGRSLRMIQEVLPLDTPLHGFDTFLGLPMAWGNLAAGAYSTGGALPNMEGDVHFHRGLFTDTIPDFLNSSKEEYQPLAFANIDCAMYTSTLHILEAMHSRVVPGTVFIFADYLCHSTWRQDEFRAWRECCKRFGWQYEYLGFSFETKQAVIRVTSA